MKEYILRDPGPPVRTFEEKGPADNTRARTIQDTVSTFGPVPNGLSFQKPSEVKTSRIDAAAPQNPTVPVPASRDRAKTVLPAHVHQWLAGVYNPGYGAQAPINRVDHAIEAISSVDSSF